MCCVVNRLNTTVIVIQSFWVELDVRCHQPKATGSIISPALQEAMASVMFGQNTAKSKWHGWKETSKKKHKCLFRQEEKMLPEHHKMFFWYSSPNPVKQEGIYILFIIIYIFFNITSFLLLWCCIFLLINTGPFIFSIESAEPHIPGPIFIQLLQLKNALKCQCRSKNFICWGEE